MAMLLFVVCFELTVLEKVSRPANLGIHYVQQQGTEGQLMFHECCMKYQGYKTRTIDYLAEEYFSKAKWLAPVS